MTAALAAPPARDAQNAAATISISGTDLQRLTAAVAPHAAEDPDTPALCAIHWEIRDGALWLAATDTCTVGSARLPLPGDASLAAGPVLVPAGDTVALAEAVGEDLAAVTIDPAAAAVTAAWSGGTYQARYSSPVQGEIPDWRRVLACLVDGTPGPSARRIMFDPAHLARFTMPPGGHADSEGLAPLVRLQLRRHRTNRCLMYLVTCQNWFIGAISPLVADPGTTELGSTVISRWAGYLRAPGETVPGGQR